MNALSTLSTSSVLAICQERARECCCIKVISSLSTRNADMDEVEQDTTGFTPIYAIAQVRFA